MKANELRIGNYVQLSGLKKPIKVSIIDTTETFTQTKFEPIPLTEEILLKCGFENNEETYVFEKQDIHIDKVNNDFIFNYFFSVVYIESVHQLQNLVYALTGQELNITL